MRQRILATLILSSACSLIGADHPEAQISNGQIRAKLYLPDAKNGFYKSTRFDWSGVISSLEYAGHNYYGPWFTGSDPSTRDFVFKGNEINVGLVSAMTGPVEEFQKPQGFDSAKPGDKFVKVGVGVLRRTDDTAYNWGKTYDLLDPGKWTVSTHADSVEFTQELSEPSLGYAYVYRKTIRLVPGKSELVMEHSLKNTGRLPIETNLYNHNFLTLDKAGPSPDFVVTVPYQIQSQRPPNPQAATITGNQFTWAKAVEGEERVSAPIGGFSTDAKDYDIRIENRKLGAGMRITCDRPLVNNTVWSIRSVIAVEPFIAIAAEPGKEFTWKYTYSYYTIEKK